MRVRLGEAAMVPDDFRSTDTVRFPASLDGLRKHFLDIARVFDAADVDFRRHSIRGAEMDAANTAQTLIEVLLKRDVPDAVQLNLVFAQVKAATLDFIRLFLYSLRVSFNFVLIYKSSPIYYKYILASLFLFSNSHCMQFARLCNCP